MKEATMDVDGMDRVERHGQAVKRFRSLCDMHRVSFGTVANLDELIATIRENRHFAMDFWAMVGDLSARERGSLDDQEMLDVIVEAVAGVEAAASVPHGQRTKLEELRQLLAGVDVARPADLPDAIAEPEDALLSAHQRVVPRVSRPGVPVVVLPEKTSSAVKVGARVRLAATDDAVETLVARRSIGEALSRLERTSTELREQLAAIDEQLGQQMTKATAAAEELHEESAHDLPEEEIVASEESAPVESADEIAARESLRKAQEASLSERQDVERQDPVAESKRTAWRRAAAPVKTTVEPEIEPVPPSAEQLPSFARQRRQEEREAEIFPHRPAHTLSQRGFAVADTDDDPSIPVPLSGYARDHSETGNGRGLAIAAVLIAVVAAGGYFFTRTDAGHQLVAQVGPTMREQYDAVAQKFGILKREATKQNTGEPATSPNPAPESTTPPATQTQPPSTAADAALNAAHSSEPPRARTAGDQTTSRTSSPAAVPQRVEPRDSGRDAVAERARSAEAPGQPTGEGLVADADTVKVAPSVMEANLIASRVPAYPEFAKAEGIEGPVVMEAVISKSGGVDHVRVIEGDRHLRSAAEDAVLKWRYKPYFVNGRPVDVATVIRVDFRLNSASRY